MDESSEKAAIQIRDLKEELRRERENSRELTEKIIQLTNEKVLAMVEAASAKATADQLREQLISTSKSVEQWVRRRHQVNLTKADYLISELSGTIMM